VCERDLFRHQIESDGVMDGAYNGQIDGASFGANDVAVGQSEMAIILSTETMPLSNPHASTSKMVLIA